jgi:hypothetical protein
MLSDIRNGPWGLSTIFRIASRMSSATLHPERAATMHSASSSFLTEVNLGLYHVCHLLCSYGSPARDFTCLVRLLESNKCQGCTD